MEESIITITPEEVLRLHTLQHTLWGKGKDREPYDKALWTEFDQLLSKAMGDLLGGGWLVKAQASVAIKGQQMVKAQDRPNCLQCKYRRRIPGDQHSLCAAPNAKVKASRYGVDGGWFHWPSNFDPNWLVSCDSFQAKVPSRA